MDYLRYFPTVESVGTGVEVDLPNIAYLQDANVLRINGEVGETGYIIVKDGMLAVGEAPIEYFAITSLVDNNVIHFSKRAPTGTLLFSYDKITWSGLTSIWLAKDSTIYLKGDLAPYQSTDDTRSGIGTFSSTGSYTISGDILSLLYMDDKTQTALPKYAFVKLFSDSSYLVDASELILRSQTLNESCYHQLLYNCQNLLYGPKVLPATTLQTKCYYYMFGHCHSLNTPPLILATSTASDCCCNMFQYCYAMVLPEGYTLYSMEMTKQCYRGMFWQCEHLTNAPILPALNLVQDCYNQMFGKCTRLNYIKAMFTTTPSSTYTYNWVTGVSGTGTFVKNSAATWSVIGANGIPSGWTVQTASE